MERANDDFLKATMRHVASLRAVGPGEEGPSGGQRFPDDWFDLPAPVLADFGALYFLMSLSRFNRDRSLAQITAQIEPPLRLGQYRIFRSNGHPRAFVTWAGLDRSAEWRLVVDRQGLRPQDWAAGPSTWVIDLVAPFGHAEQVISMLARHPTETRVRTLWHNRAGTRARVLEWSREAPGAPVRFVSYGQGQFARLLDGS